MKLKTYGCYAFLLLLTQFSFFCAKASDHGDLFGAIIFSGGNSDALEKFAAADAYLKYGGHTFFLNTDTVIPSPGDSLHAVASVQISDISVPFFIGLTSSSAVDLSDLPVASDGVFRIDNAKVPYYIFSIGNGVLYQYDQGTISPLTVLDHVSNGNIFSVYAYGGSIIFNKNYTDSPTVIYPIATVSSAISAIPNLRVVSGYGYGPTIGFSVNDAAGNPVSPFMSHLFSSYSNIQRFKFTFPATLLGALSEGSGGGSLDLDDQGILAPYSYLWPDSSTSSGNDDLPAGIYDVQLRDALSHVTHRVIDYGEQVNWLNSYNTNDPNKNLGVLYLAGTPIHGTGEDRYAVGANILGVGSSGFVEYAIHTDDQFFSGASSYVLMGLNTRGNISAGGSVPEGIYIKIDAKSTLSIAKYGDAFSGTLINSLSDGVTSAVNIGKLSPGEHRLKFRKNMGVISIYLNEILVGRITMSSDKELRPLVISKCSGTISAQKFVVRQTVVSSTVMDSCITIMDPNNVMRIQTSMTEGSSSAVQIMSPIERTSLSWADGLYPSSSDMSALMGSLYSAKAYRDSLIPTQDSSLYYVATIDTPPPYLVALSRTFNSTQRGVYQVVIQDDSLLCMPQDLAICVGTNPNFLLSNESPTYSVGKLEEFQNATLGFQNDPVVVYMKFHAYGNQGLNKAFFISPRPIADDENMIMAMILDANQFPVTLGFCNVDSPNVYPFWLSGDTLTGDTTGVAKNDFRFFLNQNSLDGTIGVTANPRFLLSDDLSLDTSPDPQMIVIMKLGDFMFAFQGETFWGFSKWPKNQGGLFVGGTIYNGSVLVSMANFKSN